MGKNEKHKKKKKKKDKKKRIKKKFLILIPIISAIVFGILENVWNVKNDIREEQLLGTKFSIAKSVDKNGFITWKISNSGEAINNATIYPSMYLSFLIYDEEHDEEIDLTLEMLGYYVEDNCYYNNLDSAFYIKDEKQSELNEFIAEHLSLLYPDKDDFLLYSTDTYFTLNYKDYKGDAYNQIYTLTDDLSEDNSDRKIFGENLNQLKEITEIPEPDIIVPVKFDKSCVISVNYENATTQQLIDNEQDYNDYLYSVILDLISSKDKPLEEMYGEAILSNGTLWRRDIDTGKLIRTADDVKDFGLLE